MASVSLYTHITGLRSMRLCVVPLHMQIESDQDGDSFTLKMFKTAVSRLSARPDFCEFCCR